MCFLCNYIVHKEQCTKKLVLSKATTAFVKCFGRVKMAYTIAFAGKGGTGKTTLTGLLIDYLSKKGKARYSPSMPTPTQISTRCSAWKLRRRSAR